MALKYLEKKKSLLDDAPVSHLKAGRMDESITGDTRSLYRGN